MASLIFKVLAYGVIMFAVVAFCGVAAWRELRALTRGREYYDEAEITERIFATGLRP